MRSLLTFLPTGFCVLFLLLAFSRSAGASATPEEQLQTVQDLIVRYVPAHASSFSLAIINSSSFLSTSSSNASSTMDVFEIEGGGDGPVQVRGTSGVALASGFYWYLKYFCNSSIFWGVNSTGLQLDIPSPLPKLPSLIRIQSPVQYRYYMNVCTVSYSAVWWDFERWQYEVDIMAMNGINLPLAFFGQEYVWAKVWSRLGLNETEFEFSGPAFLAWYRMGNIRNWGGPLDKEWREEQRVLAKQVLRLMRGYGMRPVLPCFAGHIPQAISRLYPNANITTSSPWASFNSTYGTTYLLQPTDPLFPKIGSMFIEALVDEYGTDHIYNCDTFNEMDPSTNSSSYLAASSAALVSAMKMSDPKAVWLMQGWLFLSGFWTNAAIEAYLGSVSNSDMIILDLYSEAYPIWSRTNSYFGKPFIWCMLHNFGGNRAIYGNISAISTLPLQALATPGSSMVGMGLTMEAIEQNPVIYELMMEMGWRSSPPVPSQWVQLYATRKYGASLAGVSGGGGGGGGGTLQEGGKAKGGGGGGVRVEGSYVSSAWSMLLETAYGIEDYWVLVRVPLEYTPTFNFFSSSSSPMQYINGTAMTQVVRLLLQAATTSSPNAFPSSPSSTSSLPGPFLYDLTDFSRQFLVNVFLDLYQLLNLQGQGAPLQYNSIASLGKAILGVISSMDSLLSSNENFLLGNWLQGAQSWASRAEDVPLYRFNAINQLTLWGPTGQINDYAAKQWGGLVGSYYLPRWSQFFSALLDSAKSQQQWNQTSFNAAILSWEQNYNQNPGDFPVIPTGDTVALTTQILASYATADNSYAVFPNTDVSGSSLILSVTQDTGTLSFLCNAEPTCLGFNSLGYLKSNVTSRVASAGVTLYVKPSTTRS